ncbi:MAG: ribonuclease III [Gammaproteobacteria bacterium]|nr:MAG: ribonuclease III [Gammaproteobacteria bacterium]
MDQKNANGALSRLQSRIGYTFNRLALLEQALTHRSKSKNNNERLEFLGDALLEMIISNQLFHLRPEASEGDLTRLRATMVRSSTLAVLANDLQLKDFMRMGSGELRTGGYQRKSTLADAFEAVIAAVYLDCRDFDRTADVVIRLYQKQLDELPDAQQLKDPKTRLQEYLQSKGREKPAYEQFDISGPDHNKRFEVKCCVADKATTAVGSSKKKAEQGAAEAMLKALNIVF